MIIMRAPGGCVAFRIDQVDADAARSELFGWINASKPEYLHEPFDEPFMNMPLEGEGFSEGSSEGATSTLG